MRAHTSAITNLDVFGVRDGDAGEKHDTSINLLKHRVARCGQEVLRGRAELLGGLAAICVLERHTRLGHMRHSALDDVGRLRSPGIEHGTLAEAVICYGSEQRQRDAKVASSMRRSRNLGGIEEVLNLDDERLE